MEHPSYVAKVLRRLREAGYQAVLVGGAVRDSIIGKLAHDWDLSTDAHPLVVADLFDRVITVGLAKGTVLVRVSGGEVEVTTFRLSGRSAYATPTKDLFGDSLEEDLGARDFTINAMAWSPELGLIDPNAGQADLKHRILRAVGVASDRFKEDPLRLWRGCRLVAAFGLSVDIDTATAMTAWAPKLIEIPGERLRDELFKLVSLKDPVPGFELASSLGILKVILPELEACRGVEQNPRYHRFDVWGHTMAALVAVPSEDLNLRLAVLFHDLGKPPVAEDGHFYGHESVSAHFVEDIGKRFRMGKQRIRTIAHLVRQHMFHYTKDMKASALRRFVRRVGVEHLDALLAIRQADRVGKGKQDDLDNTEDAELRERLDTILSEKAAFGVADLEIRGGELISVLDLAEGPLVGRILSFLLEQVLEDPSKNQNEILLQLGRDFRDKINEKKVS